MITRRKFIMVFGAGAFAPFASFAQQQDKVWRVGILVYRHVNLVDADYYYGPFTQGMRELGYVEGKNLMLEWRSAEGKVERLAELAAELVQLKPDVIYVSGTPATLAIQKATNTIPVVSESGDPVGSGFVKSLAKPGGNITGVSNLNGDLGPKQMEMLQGIAPKLSRVAVLSNPFNVTHAVILKSTQIAAQKVRINVLSFNAGNPQEIEHAFSAMSKQKVGALIVPLDSFFQQQKNQIVELEAKHRVPSIAAYSEYVEAGGLMSYGQNIRENNRRAATYVVKIFKGAKPAELPVEQPTTFELFINRKTAKALGLTIPYALQISATKFID